MKALRVTGKIVGLVVLVLWMAYITLRIEQMRQVVTETCSAVYSDIEGWDRKYGRKPPDHPYHCPWTDLAHGP